MLSISSFKLVQKIKHSSEIEMGVDCLSRFEIKIDLIQIDFFMTCMF